LIDHHVVIEASLRARAGALGAITTDADLTALDHRSVIG
jgi:hypothetical protein